MSTVDTVTTQNVMSNDVFYNIDTPSDINVFIQVSSRSEVRSNNAEVMSSDNYVDIIQQYDRIVEAHRQSSHPTILCVGYWMKNDEKLNDILSKLISEGIIVVASAGDDAYRQLKYPANNEYVISVGSITSDNKITQFSSLGPDVSIYAISNKSTIESCMKVVEIYSLWLMNKDKPVTSLDVKKYNSEFLQQQTNTVNVTSDDWKKQSILKHDKCKVLNNKIDVMKPSTPKPISIVQDIPTPVYTKPAEVEYERSNVFIYIGLIILVIAIIVAILFLRRK
jgi:hypothetical protein